MDKVACINAELLNCCLTNDECQERLGCALAECVLGECVQFDPCQETSATGTGGANSVGATVDVGALGVTVGIGGALNVGATVGVGGAIDAGATVGVGGAVDVGATVGIGGSGTGGTSTTDGSGGAGTTGSSGGTSTTDGSGGTSTTDGSGGASTTDGSGGASTSGAGAQGSGGTGGNTGGGGNSAAGGAPTTSTDGGGLIPCVEDVDCEQVECVISLCHEGFCATAADPTCCDVPADCDGIRCSTGECKDGRCTIDVGCVAGAAGASGAAGDAGAAGEAGATSTASGGSSASVGGAQGTADGGSGGTASGGNVSTAQGGTVQGGTGQAGTGQGGTGQGGTGQAGTGQGGTGQGGSAGSSGGGAGGDQRDETLSYELRGGACSVGLGRPNGGLWALAGLLALFAWLRRPRLPRAGRLGAKALGVGVFVLTLLGAHARALAQGSAVDEYPAPSAPDDLLWVERATPRPGALVPFGRLGLVYSKNPLVAEMSDGSEVAIIDQRLAFYASAGVSLVDRFSGAVALPVYVQEGESLAGASAGASSGIGDVALDLRAAALTREAPVELALGVGFQFPSGSQDELSGERTTSARPRVIVSKALGTRGSLITGHVGSRVRGATELGDVRLESELDLGAGGLWMFTDALGVSGEVGVRTSYRDFFDEQETPASATGGLRYQQGWVVLHGGAGTGLSSGVGSPDFRVLGMVGVAPPVPEPLADRDGDGIADLSDKCPDTPEDEDGVSDADGCPEDDDGDGVLDAVDACPKLAEDRDAFEDADGCPDPDNDGDGIADADDACPTQAEDKDNYEDADGCPDSDNDGDGILDREDQCPTEAEDKDGWQDADGCAEGDNDGDGILDAADKCPTEAETQNGVDDEDGCPDFIRVEDGQIRTLEPIFFEYGKARIQQRSEPMLSEMARTIAARPDLGRISIEGHTDDRGGEQFNLHLSEGRAAAVRDFLVDAGVPAERLSSKGFGESQPIVSNATDAGRAKNRRVEFRFAFPDAAASQESPQ